MANMYQSSTRNNFLDILLDPTAIAILASIALHAAIGVSLPFLIQPDKAGKKVGPSTVKVVELTPSELQRIPQAPPAPVPQLLPPVTPATAPQPSVIPPRSPQFGTAPQTIPFSPIRAPFDGVTIKPPQGNKQQAVTPKKQPIAPIFDPAEVFKPSPKPSKSPLPTGVTPKPSTQPNPTPTTPPKKAKAGTPTPQPSSATDDDGSDPATTPTPSPTSTKKAQQSEGTPTPSPTPTTPQIDPSPDSTANNNSSGFYGDYTKKALAKEIAYRTKYPDIVVYDFKTLTQPYPSGVPCPKKRLSFIVIMVGFGAIPGDPSSPGLESETISPPLENDKPYIDGDSAILNDEVLKNTATTAGLADAITTDKGRPVADRGKPVLYRSKVQFVCKP